MLFHPLVDTSVVVRIEVGHAVRLHHVIAQIDGNNVIQVATLGVHGNCEGSVRTVLFSLEPNPCTFVVEILHERWY